MTTRTSVFKNSLLGVLLFCISLTGCKKDETTTPEVVSPPKFNISQPADQSFPDSVTSSSALIKSVLAVTETECVEQYGHVWSTTATEPTLEKNEGKTAFGKVCGPFPLSYASSVRGLQVGKSYYLRSYATNKGGTGYGDIVKITPGGTLPSFPSARITPALSDPPVTASQINTASFIESDGGSSIEQHGFVYMELDWNNLEKGPTISDSSLKLGKYSGTFPGAFKGSITGLKSKTTYLVRPFAINAGGVSYGFALNLTTL